MPKKLLLTLAVALLLTPFIVAAQIVPAQNQVTTGPYGGIVLATSTSMTAKLGQILGSAFGDLLYWTGTRWQTAATSTLGITTPPGGLNLQVQYNNNGVFGGISGAVTNGTILNLTNPLLGGATLTTSVVNGVTLTTGGAATSFLNATGAYSVPTGGTGTVTQVNTTYPVTGGPITTTGTVALAFGTTTSNTWAGTQTFTNSPVFSTLTAGTVNSTAGGTVYNTATSTPTVTAPLTYSGTLGQFIGGVSGAFGCNVASGSQPGCLASADWTVFNNKISSTSLSATTPIFYNSSTGVISSQAASASQNGYLTSTDWSIFNNKISSSSLSGGTGITYTPATGVILNTGVISNSCPGGFLSCSGTNPSTFTLGTLGVANGGTGSTTLGGLLSGNGTSVYSSPTTTASCTGTDSCTPFTIIGTTPVTITGAGGSGTVSAGAPGQFGYYSTTGTTIAGSYFGYASSTNRSTLLGYQAGSNRATTSLVSTLRETSIGYQALTSNIGLGNTAVGYSAGSSNGTGSSNTFVGASAGAGSASNYVGSRITAVGNLAGGALQSGSDDNTLFGNASGSFITTGYGNVFVGSGAGTAAVSMTGAGNIGIGTSVVLPSPTANNQLNLGGILFGTLPATSTIFTLPVSGAIGVATSSPFATLSVQANNGATNTTLFAIGSSTAAATTTLFSVSNTGAVFTQLSNGCVQASSGVLTSIGSNCQAAGNYITALTGDVTATGPGSVPATLATVNSNVGSFTNANVTVNAKGLVTAASNGFSYPFPSSATTSVLTFSNGLTAGNTVTLSGITGTANNCLQVNTSGVVSGTGSACGSSGGAGYPFTTATNFGATMSATTTGLWGQGGLYASSSTAYPTLAVKQAGAGPAATFDGGNVGIGTTTPYAKLSVDANSSGAPYFSIGSSTSEVLRVAPSASTLVGIATSSPWRTLSIVGTMAINGIPNAQTTASLCISNTTWEVMQFASNNCIASSIKFKENVLDSAVGLEAILKLRPVSFDFKKEYINDGRNRLGLIAEEAAAVDGRFVDYDGQGKPGTLDDFGLLSALVKSVQDLNGKIESLARHAEENWQWSAILVLFVWNVWLTLNRRKAYEI